MSLDKMSPSKKIFLVLLVVLSAVSLLLVGHRAYAQTARVYLDPTPLILGTVGASGTVTAKLENVSGSAGFEFKFSFDNSIVQIDDVNLLIPASGVIPVKNIDNQGGTVTFGAAALRESGVWPNILSGTPLELAKITVSAVGEGTSNLAFDASYILYGTEMGADDLPVRLESTLTDGQVKVGETPPEGPTINLSSGGNTVVWPAGLNDFTSLSTVRSIAEDCEGVVGISRKRHGWWESAVSDYSGANFNLSEGSAYYIKVASSCTWTP